MFARALSMYVAFEVGNMLGEGSMEVTFNIEFVDIDGLETYGASSVRSEKQNGGFRSRDGEAFFFQFMQHCTKRGFIHPGFYRHSIRSLHTDFVSETCKNKAFLWTNASSVAPEANLLLWPFHSAWRIFRSGYSSLTISFQERIGRAPSHLCPSIFISLHTNAQNLSCPLLLTNKGCRVYGTDLAWLCLSWSLFLSLKSSTSLFIHLAPR